MIVNLWIWTIILIDLVSSDNRCFLENGGSAENFFVSESLPVGSTIGALKIHGNPSEKFGDITLRLHRADSPVRIAQGSKNLTLARQLDKEGVIGPSSVYVNILCERRGVSSDPGYVIPVNIRVTDANDNAPEFINGSFVLNISEVTVVGTRVLQGIRAVDKDQQGPFSTVQYSVLPGPYSDYFVFLNALEGTLVLRKSLDYETVSNFTVKIRAQDQGSPPQFSDTEIKVNVIDADDQNPRFVTERYAAVLPQHPTVGSRVRLTPHELAALDQDKGINSPVYYSFNSDIGDYQLFSIEPATGVITIAKEFQEDDLTQPATLVIRATQVDNKDRYALATVTISRKGAIQALHFLQEIYLAGILENAPANSVVITAVTNRPRDRRVKYWLDKEEGVFGVTSTGDIILLKSLDYETRDVYVFRVHVTDGRVNDTSLVNVTVLNVNDWDPRFRYPQYEFFVTDKNVGPGYVIGNIEAADGDRGDHLTLSLRGSHAHLFQISDSGQLTVSSLDTLNTTDAHIVALATDAGLPPRQASVPITIHFPNDAIRAASTWAVGGTSFVMITVFTSLLLVLLTIIIALGVYIHRGKTKKVEDSSEKSNSSTSTDCKTSDSSSLSPNIVDMEGRVFNVGTLPLRNPQYTATVKSIMSRTGSSRNFNPQQNAKNRIAPLPPQIPEEQECTCSLGSREWMEGSIPRRVKKLSWDDDNDNDNDNDNIQRQERLLSYWTMVVSPDQCNCTKNREFRGGKHQRRLPERQFETDCLLLDLRDVVKSVRTRCFTTGQGGSLGSNCRKTLIASHVFLKMLAVMEPNPEPSQDPVSEFLVTGRTGRRNAMADILGPHATTSSGDLPEKLQTLCTAEPQEGSSTANQVQGESKPENPGNVPSSSVNPGEQLQPHGNS